MPYATLDDLLHAATGGWPDLAQRASASPLVDGALLQATASGADRSDWTPEARALADTALARLHEVLERASRHTDTYLFPRYRSALPLAEALVRGSDLPSAVAAIAYKRLYGAQVPEDVRRGVQWADDYLRDIARGVVSLGTADTAVAQGTMRTQVRAPKSRFDLTGF
jgi:phage gp36-like protein